MSKFEAETTAFIGRLESVVVGQPATVVLAGVLAMAASILHSNQKQKPDHILSLLDLIDFVITQLHEVESEYQQGVH